MSKLPELTEAELRERFDDLLDDLQGEVKILGYTFFASRILRDVDLVVYECELRNYADSIRDEYLVVGWND